MLGMGTGFAQVHTDLSTLIVPLGGIILLGGGLVAAIHYRHLVERWLSSLLAIAAASASMAVAAALYNYFHT